VLIKDMWSQDGLPDGGQMPGKYTWLTNTLNWRNFFASFKV